MKVAVTGATGSVGRFIVARMVAEGAAVRAWRRLESDLRGLPDVVEWTEGELGSQNAAEALVDGADALVHAALDHLPGRYRGGEGDDLSRFLRINVGESLALFATARAAGVRRCVFISSRAVFGAEKVEGPIADETPPRPDTSYGAAKAAVEAFVGSWGREGWPIAALRPTGVYGLLDPAERSKWFGLVGCVLRGEPVEPRAGTEVHGRDVAESVWRLLTAEPGAVAGRSFNCSDIAVSTREIASLAQRFGGVSGPLPDPCPPPTNVVNCAGLAQLGVVFGGRPLLERTVAELVAAVQAES